MSSRLECRNLTKDYGNVMALSDVNLTLESGRIVLFCQRGERNGEEKVFLF